MQQAKTKHFVYLAMLCAMAIVLSLIEAIYIGAIIGVLRIGLANIIALITIHLLSEKDMLVVNTMRVVVSTLLRGMLFGTTFWISLGGVLLSSFVLIVLYRLKSSILFTSILCAVAHSVGQILVVMAFYNQPGFVAYLPYLLAGSIPMGVLTAMVAQLVLSRTKPLHTHIS